MSRRARLRPRSRPATSAPPLAPVEAPTSAPATIAGLLELIADGRLDAQIEPIAEAISARALALQASRSASALAGLDIGDVVRINHNATPRYLHGVQGKIIDLDDRYVTVCVHRPIGRFHTGHVRCPPLALDKIVEPATVT